MTGTSGGSRQTWPTALWIIVGLGLVLRAAALALAPSLTCLADECFYTHLATRLAAGEGFRSHAGHYWPPGYITFLALHLRAGVGILGAKASQVLLSTALIPLVHALGVQAAAAAGGEAARRCGLMAAALVAFDPTLIAYSHYLWSETLFLPLFTGALLLVLALAARPAAATALLAGALLGAASLIKVLPVYLAPLLAAWIALRPGAPRRRLSALLLLAATFAVIAPWTARNALVHGRFVLVETTTGKNLVRGNNPRSVSNWDWGYSKRSRRALQGVPCHQVDLVDLNACLTRHGVSLIVSHPERFLARAGTKLADLVNPTSFLVRHVRRGVYGAWPPWLATLAVAPVALFNAAIMMLALVGWRHRPAGPARSLCALVVIYVVAVHLITFAMSRFRLPLAPLLATGAALALTVPTAARDAQHRARYWVTAVLLAILALGFAARIGPVFYAAPPGESMSPGEPSDADL